MHVNVTRLEISFRLNIIESDCSAYSTCVVIHETKPNDKIASHEIKVSDETFLAFSCL